jgi:hypothetical protein
MKLCDVQIEGIINSVNGTYTPGPHERAHIAKCLPDTVLALATEAQESRARITKLEEVLSEMIDHTLNCELRIDELSGLGADAGAGCSVVVLNARAALEATL